MTSPEGLNLIAASALFVSTALLFRYRSHAAARQARADESEDARLTGWVQDLHTAGQEQATDPNLGLMIRRYAELQGTGLHRASRERPATMGSRA